VLAVDASPHAVDATRARMEQLAPEAVAEGRLATEQADLLALPPSLAGRRFDLVYSFGVLHHTGDTRRALAHLAPLVRPDGLLFLYLYGAASVSTASRLALALARASLSPLPYRAKKAVLAQILPGRDTHQAFDLLSPLVNDRFERPTVEAWLQELGFADVAPTLDHTEIFLRACGEACSARPFLPPASPPYWFERYRRRR
jgi:SAM-dependent methyltransferase